MDRRSVLAAPLALAAGCAPARAAPSPREIGARAANAYLAREDFMIYEVGDVVAVHYAEVASAFGAARLAAATGDAALMARVIERHSRLISTNLPNSANQVDANVYGVWPLEIYLRTGEMAYRAAGLAMADGQWAAPREDGLSAQTRFRIDDVWMIGALQMQAWRASGGGADYLDRAARTAAAYIERLQQPNGLFHHGAEAPFFWGRGNGWMAAGLAEVLCGLPHDHSAHGAIEAGFQRMMEALIAHQGEDGMWRQLIDYPEAWAESSATAMFGYALAAGVNAGLLRDSAHRAARDRAWAGLGAYVGADGQVRDVCIGAGQSRDRDYYLDRPTATGDLHGQAPVLWFAAALLEA